MRITCHAPGHFILERFDGTTAGQIVYESTASEGVIKTELLLMIEHADVGRWHTSIMVQGRKKIIAEIKIRPGGWIMLSYIPAKKKYKLRCAGIYKNRFVLCNGHQDELLSLLPAINWNGRGHEYAIQVNEEFSSECNPLLILHAIHCANCYLGMLNGVIPALINI